MSNISATGGKILSTSFCNVNIILNIKKTLTFNIGTNKKWCVNAGDILKEV
jgi:hypothetical protein